MVLPDTYISWGVSMLLMFKPHGNSVIESGPEGITATPSVEEIVFEGVKERRWNVGKHMLLCKHGVLSLDP